MFSRGVGWDIVWIGLVTGTLSLTAGYLSWRAGDPHWRTLTFTTLVLSQLALAFAVRSERESLWSLGLLSNRALPLAAGASAVLQLAVVYAPPLQRVFHTRALSAYELGVCCGAATAVFAAVEASKALRRRIASRRHTIALLCFAFSLP